MIDANRYRFLCYEPGRNAANKKKKLLEKQKKRNKKKVEKLSKKVASKKKLTNKKSGALTNEVCFYKTREWLELRYWALELYGRKCMSCFSVNSQLHVDHIKPISIYPLLKTDKNNLQILCKECNLGKSNKWTTDLRANALKNPIESKEKE